MKRLGNWVKFVILAICVIVALHSIFALLGAVRHLVALALAVAIGYLVVRSYDNEDESKDVERA